MEDNRSMMPSRSLRILLWTPLAIFLLLLVSIVIVGGLPFEKARAVMGAAEWIEMLLGSAAAVIAIALTVFKWNQPQFSARHKALAIAGFCLWLAFWVLTLAVPHGGG
jgi:putative effector of murein hydrolase